MNQLPLSRALTAIRWRNPLSVLVDIFQNVEDPLQVGSLTLPTGTMSFDRPWTTTIVPIDHLLAHGS